VARLWRDKAACGPLRENVQGRKRQFSRAADLITCHRNREVIYRRILTAELIKPLIPAITWIIEQLTDFIRWVKEIVVAIKDGLVAFYNWVIEHINTILEMLPGIQLRLNQIEKNTKPPEEKASGMDDLLGLKAPQIEENAMQQMMKQLQQPLNIPAFAGF
ncbi:MAG: hypothetical protein JNM56_19505, partial [Planctomycetia bacterium]|nr:hypothetical protein [Planctomycetia bacterium]